MASHHLCLYPLASHQRTTPGSALTRCRTHRHWLQYTEPVLSRNGSEDESADSPLPSVAGAPTASSSSSESMAYHGMGARIPYVLVPAARPCAESERTGRAMLRLEVVVKSRSSPALDSL